MDKPGFSLRLFFVDANPKGLRIIEKSNWSGKGLAFPRNLLIHYKEKQIDEFRKPGVYLLLGLDDDGTPKVYVGEGDPVIERFQRHYNDDKKLFWNQTIFFVSKDNNLTKTHIQYLESKILALGRNIGKAKFANENKPTLPTISEADKADCDSFLEEVILCLSALSIDYFHRKQTLSKNPDSPNNEDPSTKSDDYLSVNFLLNAKGISAQGGFTSDGFRVFKGSMLSNQVQNSCGRSNQIIREKLLEIGVVVKQDGKLYFEQDYDFNSPSQAAAVVLGNSINGREAWRDANGKSIKDYDQIVASAPQT